MRYVILHHRLPEGSPRADHWDLMLEQPQAGLRTWALSRVPTSHASEPQRIEAEQLADHRSAYLDYEGPIAGNRGQVTRYDQGTYTQIAESPDRLVVQLAGHQLSCTLRLERLDPAERLQQTTPSDATQPDATQTNPAQPATVVAVPGSRWVATFGA